MRRNGGILTSDWPLKRRGSDILGSWKKFSVVFRWKIPTFSQFRFISSVALILFVTGGCYFRTSRVQFVIVDCYYYYYYYYYRKRLTWHLVLSELQGHCYWLRRARLSDKLNATACSVCEHWCNCLQRLIQQVYWLPLQQLAGCRRHTLMPTVIDLRAVRRTKKVRMHLSRQSICINNSINPLPRQPGQWCAVVHGDGVCTTSVRPAPQLTPFVVRR